MSDEYQFNTRMNRHRKKKNSKKTTIYVAILSLIFIILLITLILIITSNKNDNQSHELMNNNQTEDNNDDNGKENEEDKLNENIQNENDSTIVENNNEGEMNESNPELQTNSTTENDSLDELEVVHESEDDNVLRTYIGNWEPIGTVQTGEHVTNYEDGSVDRIEIEKASSKVTGIPVDNMFVGWVGNDGHQKVFTIISNENREEFYKLYLSWIDGEGWQVTKVEKIKEFDIDDYRN